MWNAVLRAAVVVFTFATFTSVQAAVYNPQQQLPSATIDAFKSNPAQLLKQYPTGGAELIARVRDLAATEPSTLPLLIELLKNADPVTQVPAIATGLAQVARLASKTNQNYGNQIQAAVAGSGNSIAIAAYQASTGDAPIGAGAAGGAGAGGGGTGVGGATGNPSATGGNNGGIQNFGGLHYANQVGLLPNANVGALTAITSPVQQ